VTPSRVWSVLIRQDSNWGRNTKRTLCCAVRFTFFASIMNSITTVPGGLEFVTNLHAWEILLITLKLLVSGKRA
jgi:hypothetical protein